MLRCGKGSFSKSRDGENVHVFASFARKKTCETLLTKKSATRRSMRPSHRPDILAVVENESIVVPVILKRHENWVEVGREHSCGRRWIDAFLQVGSLRGRP